VAGREIGLERPLCRGIARPRRATPRAPVRCSRAGRAAPGCSGVRRRVRGSSAFRTTPPAGWTLRTFDAVIFRGCAGAMLAGPSSAMVPRPHDALFKSAFEAPADAAALLLELLPVVLCELVAWE